MRYLHRPGAQMAWLCGCTVNSTDVQMRACYEQCSVWHDGEFQAATSRDDMQYAELMKRGHRDILTTLGVAQSKQERILFLPQRAVNAYIDPSALIGFLPGEQALFCIATAPWFYFVFKALLSARVGWSCFRILCYHVRWIRRSKFTPLRCKPSP